MQMYKSRSIIVFFFFGLGYLIVAANLFYLQLLQHNFFTQLGEKQYHLTINSFAPRGTIIDRTGKNFLAINKDSLAAFILPRQLEMQGQLEKFLATHFPQALARLHAQPQAHFLYVHRKLTPEQVTLITNSGVTDIKFLNEPNRFYPLSTTGPLIGITDIDNKGLFGLEFQFDTLLAGKSSTVILEKDARSNHFYFKKETMQEGCSGTSIQLTIDSDLQFLVHQAVAQTVEKFDAQEGAALIMDPITGDILVMVNVPSFDPNNFQESNLALTKNKSVTESYELGSVFKIFCALAALEENLVTTDELIDCKNAKTAYIDGRKINTTIAGGVIPFKEVITTSNNIGIAQVAKRLDKKIYNHYKKLGFGKKTGIPFPGENKGSINDPANWSKQSIISLSYGYEVSANLLQLARAFCIIANGGYWIMPRLTSQDSPNLLNEKLYSDAAIATIQELLECTTAQGTAKQAHIQGYRVMAKTGTANMLENGHYNPDHNIFTCAGIVQKGDYKKVIVVFIKQVAQKDLYASSVAAPLFEQIAQMVLIKDKII